jgi:pimeloyl-ACP methyl ester carboxylesterase/outer membrane protein assembly factor BamB
MPRYLSGATGRSFLCGVALLCGLAGVLAVPWSASAAPVPLWSEPITTSSWAAYGAGGREVLYLNLHGTGALDTERVFTPDGAVEYEAEPAPFVIVPPALAEDGSGYVLQADGAAGVIDAINTTGKVRWSYVVPTGDSVQAVLAGDDGAAYVAMSTAIDVEVLRLSPEDGSVTFATPVPEADAGVARLLAEPNGVAAITGTSVLFLSQAGQITADVESIPTGASTSFASGSVPATSNNAGDVFVGYVPEAGGGEADTSSGIYVSEIDPTGHVDWTTQTPANGGAAAPTILAALPDGGVAFEVSGESVGVLNADGSTRWSTENTEGYGPMLADSSDHIDLESLVVNGKCSDEVDNCDGFRISQLSATDGELQNSVDLVSESDPSRFWYCGGFALGPGLFYVMDRPAPPDGVLCGQGATQPQLQAYALPGTTGPYPSPPATTIPPATTSGGAGSGGGGSGSGATHNLPIVMIPGISSETPGTRREHGKTLCPSKEPFHTMCLALQAKGYPVYVVSASEGPSTNSVLNSWGNIDADGASLTQYLKEQHFARPPLLVGHSMGGLIARDAIGFDGASAAGLLSVGTPYDGSFFADFGSTFSNTEFCYVLAVAVRKPCLALEDRLNSKVPLDTEAAQELTGPERIAEASHLPIPTLPIWTLAGTAVALPIGIPETIFGVDSTYYFPNDLLVGRSSAWGLDAHLGPTCQGPISVVVTGCDHRLTVDATHFAWLHYQGETEDADVIDDVMAVADALEAQARSSVTATAASRRSSAYLADATPVQTRAVVRGAERRLRPKPVIRSVSLATVRAGRAAAARSVTVRSSGTVVSNYPFSVSCDGAHWKAENVAPEAWAAFGDAVQCAATAKLPAGATYLETSSEPAIKVRAGASTLGTSTTVWVSGLRGVSAELSRFGRHVAVLRRRHGRLQITVRNKQTEVVIITVLVGRAVCVGTVTI